MSREKPDDKPDDPMSGLGAAGAASVGAGAALTAGVASACCVGPVAAPLMVGVLGAGGAAWAASLEPFSPLLLGVSGILLAFSFWSLYGRGSVVCDTDEETGGLWKLRLARGVVWVAAGVWVVSLSANAFLGGT